MRKVTQKPEHSLSFVCLFSYEFVDISMFKRESKMKKATILCSTRGHWRAKSNLYVVAN